MPIEIYRGNITELQVDAIVNAANEDLVRGSGVCGAIFKVAGPQLKSACDSLAPCPTGSAVITKGFDSKAKFIIHAVGPVYYRVKEKAPELLAYTYWDSLRLATLNDISSIAFPSISTGVYGYPKDEAAKIAFSTVERYLTKEHNLKVIFVCFEAEDFRIYQELLHKYEIEKEKRNAESALNRPIITIEEIATLIEMVNEGPSRPLENSDISESVEVEDSTDAGSIKVPVSNVPPCQSLQQLNERTLERGRFEFEIFDSNALIDEACQEVLARIK